MYSLQICGTKHMLMHARTEGMNNCYVSKSQLLVNISVVWHIEQQEAL